MNVVARAGLLAPLLAMTVVMTSCGKGADSQTAAQSTPTVASPQTEAPPSEAQASDTPKDLNKNNITDSDPADGDWPGKMTPEYTEASSKEAARGRDFMESQEILQQFADDMNGTLKFAQDIPLQGKQCDEANLYWNPADKAVVLCYEGVAGLLDKFSTMGDASPDQAVFDTELLGFYHESGHMAIDIYDLPAVGREEDDADQVSAYMMLKPNADGSVPTERLDAITNAARSFAADADQSTADDAAMADVHSPTKARLYNLLCWTYGADPSYGEKFVADGALPKERAEGCQDEYAKLRRSWDRLLGPYLR